jgi:hypothetical protein
VDLDADGLPDVISGSYPGELYVFRGRRAPTEGGHPPQLGRRKFAEAEPIKDRDGKVISVDYASSLVAADWDGDDDFDLLVGTIGGAVHLIVNEGSPQRYAFGKPQPLLADGKPIVAPGGSAAPAVADWDGDGKPDLLLGAQDGSVLLFRNAGTPKAPKLAAAETLVPPPKQGSQRGTYAKICVTDWNEDGRLDLVVGDCGEGFVKQLSEEEERWRDEVRRQQAELLAEWAGVFREYRALLHAPEPQDPPQRQQHQARLQVLREHLQQLNRVRDTFSRKEQSLEPGRQYHGRVWLYLRSGG